LDEEWGLGYHIFKELLKWLLAERLLVEDWQLAAEAMYCASLPDSDVSQYPLPL